MNEHVKTNHELIEEISVLKQKIIDLEQLETARKLAEEALRESEGKYQFVVENLKVVVFRTDAAGHWTFLNSAWDEVTGFAVEESLGNMFLEYVYPEDRQLNLELFRPLIERAKDYCRHEIRYMNKDGGFRWIEVWAQLTLDEKGNATGTAGTLTDITERKRVEEKLKHFIIHDSLTGLHNRFFFEEELRRLSTGRFDPIGIVMCDLDGLKLVNDNLGHDVGDRLLITAANLIKELFRISDIVARIGGDEFAVLLPGCPSGMTSDICNRLKQAMTNRRIPDTNIPLMMSIGYAIRDGQESSIEELVKEADVNMYKEKIHNRQAYRELFDEMILH